MAYEAVWAVALAVRALQDAGATAMGDMTGVALMAELRALNFRGLLGSRLAHIFVSVYRVM
jgi:hypothetical protein